MLQWEHSAILTTFIKLQFVIKIFVLSIFEWLLKTVFTVNIRPPDKSVLESYFLYYSSKTYVVGIQKNRLNETVLLSTQNVCLN